MRWWQAESRAWRCAGRSGRRNVTNLKKFKKSHLVKAKILEIDTDKEKIRLASRSNEIPEFIDVIEKNKVVGKIKPFHGGETLKWQVEGIVN